MSRTHIKQAREQWTDFVDTVPVAHHAHELHDVRTGCVGACNQGRTACRDPGHCTNRPTGYSRAWWIAVLLCLAAALVLAIAPPA